MRRDSDASLRRQRRRGEAWIRGSFSSWRQWRIPGCVGGSQRSSVLALVKGFVMREPNGSRYWLAAMVTEAGE